MPAMLATFAFSRAEEEAWAVGNDSLFQDVSNLFPKMSFQIVGFTLLQGNSLHISVFIAGI